jgi:tripartite-type tricarboxylate transporter receptor subunit TctC
MTKIVIILLSMFAISATATEKIMVIQTQAASHAGTPQMLKVIEAANTQQKDYQFFIDFRPGAQETLGLHAMLEDPQKRVATIAPGFVESVEMGLINEKDYVSVFSQGDSCWALITNVGDQKKGLMSLEDMRGKEIVVGGTGFGNAAHLTSLMLAEKYGFKVRYIVYKSNYDALVNMAGDNGINMLLERVKNFKGFKEKNNKLQMLGMSCPSRHPDAPDVKTLKESGFNAPYVFQMIVASKDMNMTTQKSIEKIFEQATLTVGQKAIQELSDQNPPIFNKISSRQHFDESIVKMKVLRGKFKTQIDASK